MLKKTFCRATLYIKSHLLNNVNLNLTFTFYLDGQYNGELITLLGHYAFKTVNYNTLLGITERLFQLSRENRLHYKKLFNKFGKSRVKLSNKTLSFERLRIEHQPWLQGLRVLHKSMREKTYLGLGLTYLEILFTLKVSILAFLI